MGARARGASGDGEPARAMTPAPLRAHGDRGERTRRRLLQAAEEVFSAYSYHDASIVKITEAAGVAQGTFYLYFAGKRQIFEELVDDLNTRVRQAMREAAHGAENRLEAERRGFRAFFEFTAAHPSLYRVIRQAEFTSPEALHRHYQRIAEGYIEALDHAMDTGEVVRADAKVLAWCLMGIGELVGMRWILWDRKRHIPAPVFEEVVAFIERGLGVARSTE